MFSLSWIGIQEWKWNSTYYMSLCQRYRYSFNDHIKLGMGRVNHYLDFITDELGHTKLAPECPPHSPVWSCDITLLELEQSYISLGFLPKVLVSLCLCYLFNLPPLPNKNMMPVIIPGRKHDVILMSDQH